MEHSALIAYTLRGLNQCYMPEHGLWSYRRHLDGRLGSNESRPRYDVFYTLNVILGLSKLTRSSSSILGIDPTAMFHKAAARLDEVGAPLYAYGTALWAAAELRIPVPGLVTKRVQAMTDDPTAIQRWTAQEIGMLLSGATAQARNVPSWTALASHARTHILRKLRTESGLFRDCAFGVRRRFATFASQVYCALSLYDYGKTFDDPEASQAADSCVRTLISLQGPFGEWPWFFHAESGRVMDFYEVYSVHQHGMAPAILKEAMRRHVPGAKAALIKGFAWILGENELGCTMLRPDLSLIARSQARRGLSAGRAMRACRASVNLLTGRQARICGRPTDITVTPEVRSYELGWTLWSFGDDVDFPELTDHGAFSVAKHQPAEFSACLHKRSAALTAPAAQGA